MAHIKTMIYLIKRFTIYFLTAALSIFSTSSFAESACDYDVLGLKPGITKSMARDLMLEKGFLELPVSRSGGMRFTNRAPWPPAGVTLNRAQLRLATQLQDPRRRKLFEKRAETDPALKKRLAEVASVPPKKNSDTIDVRIGLAKASTRNATDNETLIAGVHAEYHFPSDESGTKAVYSPAHKETNKARWARYCSDVSLSGLRDRRFMEKNDGPVRVCQDNPGASGFPIQIMLQPSPAAKKQGCNYTYMAGPLSSSENLK